MSQQINLFDERFRRQKPHLSARTMVQALAAVFVVALAFQALYAYQNRSLQSTLAQTDQRATELRDQTIRFAKEFTAQGRSSALTDEIARVEERLRTRRGLLAGMQGGAGGNVDGFSPYLTALARQTMSGVWLTGVEIGSSGELVLKGRVMDSALVPAYIRQLRKEQPFAGRAVSELRVSAKSESEKKADPATPARFVEFSLSIPLATKGAS